MLDFSLWTKLLFKDQDMNIYVINCDGPYASRQSFWDSFYFDCTKREFVIIGGDMNFTLSRSKVWGSNARTYPQFAYFRHKLEEANFIDLERVKLSLTRWNIKR
jgi:hypothetical protein